MFDRAVEEFRDTRPEDDDGLGDASQMIGILARLGSSKRALAVGLGSGGAAGTFPAVRCNVPGSPWLMKIWREIDCVFVRSRNLSVSLPSLRLY